MGICLSPPGATEALPIPGPPEPASVTVVSPFTLASELATLKLLCEAGAAPPPSPGAIAYGLVGPLTVPPSVVVNPEGDMACRLTEATFVDDDAAEEEAIEGTRLGVRDGDMLRPWKPLSIAEVSAPDPLEEAPSGGSNRAATDQYFSKSCSTTPSHNASCSVLRKLTTRRVVPKRTKSASLTMLMKLERHASTDEDMFSLSAGGDLRWSLIRHGKLVR